MLKLEKEFNFFEKNKTELVKKYKDKYIVIKNCKILGVYNSLVEAIRETSKHEKLGTFLVQKCSESDKFYTQTFHSRVTFPMK